ncbi:MAG: GNAT family N-acetyltransferase [Myxococcales bacterium]|nr:GNAT family N-acetyltransferase [Myxococcales bacterium]
MLPERLPSLHEAQEQLETRNIVDAGLGEALGLTTRDWESGLWTIRTRAAPHHRPGNQITGLTPAHLDALPTVLAWFDEAGTDVNLRWPGPALDHDVGRALAALGFVADELEAWMAAPITDLQLDAAVHDIREVTSVDDARAFGEAFVGGWQIPEALQEVGLAAMAPWPAPPAWRRYVAWVDGAPAGESLLSLFDDVAYLAEAATVGRFRRRGIQRAMIARRVADAREAGATTVFGAVQYGDQSWANMRALGLREAFLTMSFKRSGRPASVT